MVKGYKFRVVLNFLCDIVKKNREIEKMNIIFTTVELSASFRTLNEW